MIRSHHLIYHYLQHSSLDEMRWKIFLLIAVWFTLNDRSLNPHSQYSTVTSNQTLTRISGIVELVDRSMLFFFFYFFDLGFGFGTIGFSHSDSWLILARLQVMNTLVVGQWVSGPVSHIDIPTTQHTWCPRTHTRTRKRNERKKENL